MEHFFNSWTILECSTERKVSELSLSTKRRRKTNEIAKVVTFVFVKYLVFPVAFCVSLLFGYVSVWKEKTCWHVCV